MSSLKRELSAFDLTNIVVGSVVGADIYVASAIAAGLLGPASIVVWAAAGIAAVCLALVFAYCSFYLPSVGGPFAFVSAAFDDFWGFLAGWSLWIAELMAPPIFALAFASYLGSLVDLNRAETVVVKAAFLLGLTGINIIGVRAAGKLNDLLTILKLCPLFVLIIAGAVWLTAHPTTFTNNYTPFAPKGWDQFQLAFALIFWAYVGFEMGTLPASEVKEPARTVPRAIIRGMVIVAAFYLLTNFVISGVADWRDLAQTPTPLVLVGTLMLGTAGMYLMSVGALISVAGSDESGTLGTARLSYAMAVDGLFPRVFAQVHKRFGTPYMALLIQGLLAFFLSLSSSIRSLITFSMFTMAFAFLLTSLSLVVLQRQKDVRLPGQGVLPWLGAGICVYLLYATTWQVKAAGAGVMLAGIPLYLWFSPKTDIHHLKALLITEEQSLVGSLARRERFLGNLVYLLNRGVSALRRRSRRTSRSTQR